jgi:flagellar motility protein MotE (MotC chaperone)
MAEKRLSREEARELYDDLQKAMTQMMAKRGQPVPAAVAQAQSAGSASTGANAKVAKEIADAIKSGLNGKPLPPPAPQGSARTAPRTRGGSSGAGLPMTSAFSRTSGRTPQGAAGAVAVVSLFCCAKIALSALAASGIVEVERAEASATIAPQVNTGPQWSKEEVKVLTALDHRRAELEERSARVEQRELELVNRDRDIAARLTELKELTERLKIERQKGDKQRSAQLDQLANVYGSMNPPEAAHLLEQLDMQVCLSLIERMPEKRIGQILSLMNAQRALELTNLLSKRSR